jgi:hypothetical protein
MGLLSKAVANDTHNQEKKGPGLLSKALVKAEYGSADEMGRALRDRLLRLSQNKSSPFTVLSLLKAYASFQAGLCLALKNGAYHDYASVGMGIAKTAIPQNRLNGEGSFFKAGSAEELSLPSLRADLLFWAFPLDDRVPPGRLLLLGGDPPPSVKREDSPPDPVLFDPESLAGLVHDIRAILVPPREEEPPEPVILNAEPDDGPPESASEIKAALAEYHRKNPRFQGVILEPLEDIRRASAMTASFGAVIPLPSGRGLALFPSSLDRELAAHRLSKDLPAASVFSFEADDPAGAFELIRPYC